MATNAPRKIKLDIISDVLCAWCYVGHVEIEKAIAQARAAGLPATFEIQYHPYQLCPSLSLDDPVDRTEFYHNKFGKEKWEQITEMMIARGKQDGLQFSFGGKMRQTTNAHRFITKAYQVGGQDLQNKFLIEIFKANFEQEVDIGDFDNLARFAEAAGIMTKDEALAFLNSNELKEEVAKRCEEAQKKNISGVPFTIINHKWAVGGCQNADVYFKIFEKLAPVNPQPPPSVPQTPKAEAAATPA